MPAPWKVLRSHRDHDFTILTIREDIVADPRTHKEHPRVVIDCPDWVNVVALTPERRVVMVRQWRVGASLATLEVPGGMIDRGEAPRDAAIRELEEETGFRAGRVIPLGAVHPNPAIQTNRSWTFLAEECVRVHDGHPDEGEDLRIEQIALDEIPNWVARGDITHALTVSAFYLYSARRA